jgi:hypothetical protein
MLSSLSIVSLPSSPESEPVKLASPVKRGSVEKESLENEQELEKKPAITKPAEAVQVKSESVKVNTIRSMPQSLQALPEPVLGQTTPQKRAMITTTPPRPEPKTSPFRTPTGKSRQSIPTIESLGLSPQDSVFWAKTPPSEALKKLELMNTGRSHEEGKLMLNQCNAE